jgi:hypothetical protein
LLALCCSVAEELHRALDHRIDLARWRAVTTLEEIAQLVDDDVPALRREDVEERLRAEDLPDRRGERRPAGLAPDVVQLLEDVV